MMVLALGCSLLAGLQSQVSDPAEPLRKFWKPVTLTAKDTSSRVLLARIFEKSGETLPISEEWEPKDISIDLQGVSFWQAIDEVCRRDGGLHFASIRGRWELGPRAGPPPVVAYAGPVRFSIHNVTRVREWRYPDRLDRTELSLVLHWTSGYSPALDPWPYPGTVEVVRADDGKGRTLLPPVDAGGTFIRSAGGSSDRMSTWILRLQPADRAEKSIARLDLVWKVLQPVEVEEVVFDTPLQAEGQSRRIGDFTVTLDRCRRDAKGGPAIETHVELRVDPSNLAPEVRRSLESAPLDRRLLQEVEIDGKKKRQVYFRPVGDTKDPFKATLRVWLDGDQSPVTVKFQFAKRISALSVPLTFTDIPLPEVEK